MFDSIFAYSYIDVKYEGRLYLRESYSELKSLMNNSNSSITVHVLDFITGIFEDTRTIQKSDISSYGEN